MKSVRYSLFEKIVKEADMKNRIKGKKFVYTLILYVIFMIYLFVLFKIVLFKYFSLGTVLRNVVSGELRGFRSLNLIPFRTVVDFADIIKEGRTLWGISNILGNILIFAPFGYFLPLLFFKRHKKGVVILTGALLSLLFETMQYFFYLGSGDVDDVILNTLGVGVGYGFYSLVGYFIKSNYKKYNVTIFLSVICFAGAFLVAREQFGTILGLKNSRISYEGEENIPERGRDYDGTFLERKEDTLYFYPMFVSEEGSEKQFLEIETANITKKTKFYDMRAETSKKGTTICYEELSEGEIEDTGAYSRVCIWMNGTEAEVVLFTERQKKSTEMKAEVRSEDTAEKERMDVTEEEEGKETEELWGYVVEVNEDGFVMNMGSIVELENGASIAETNEGKNKVLVPVVVDEKTVYRKKLVHDIKGERVNRIAAKREEIHADMQVNCKGHSENGQFVAEEIEMRIFTFME